MKKRNGFTLVELLAVIVILAIILVIAVPQIMKTIEDARRSSMESSAKMVAAAAEREYSVSQVLEDKNSSINWTAGVDCINSNATYSAAWAGLTDADYATCTAKIENGTAKVTLTGTNKFDGYTCTNATRTNATCSKAQAAS